MDLTYFERDRLLYSLGYRSYRAYLKSELWRGIRARVLGTGRRCAGCDREGPRYVHHLSYTREDLLGETLANLVAICRKCHRRLEFTGRGTKRPAGEVRSLCAERLRTRRFRRVVRTWGGAIRVALAKRSGGAVG